ncbi:WbqC family protein [Hyphobacterium sp. CCMP332]|nr:WbqC family protein [Hyphobacterium sp. CCMP332]
MKLAIMQPYIFPYLGYFQLINAVDKFIFYDDVNFIKKGWINRNQILINGRVHKFSIPLLEASQNKKINEIEVSSEDKWRKKLLKSIEMAYKKSPFFDKVFPIVVRSINNKETNLSKFIINSLKEVIDYLDLTTAIVYSSKGYNNQDLSGQDRIIDICKKEGCDHYINPINGRLLYDKKRFDNERMKLNFISTGELQYNQYSKDFVPYLSIIDVMMFNKKSIIKDLLEEYELV